MNTAKPSLYEIENAFQPAKEISNIERFAGRAKPVSDAFLALMVEGANIAIVGNRGIGKTSLARQIQNFARGDNSLLRKLAIDLGKRPACHAYGWVGGWAMMPAQAALR
ncbi:MAG: hypothetical protein ACREFP_02110 [Acetobacteraceae bacterium]